MLTVFGCMLIGLRYLFNTELADKANTESQCAYGAFAAIKGHFASGHFKQSLIFVSCPGLHARNGHDYGTPMLKLFAYHELRCTRIRRKGFSIFYFAPGSAFRMPRLGCDPGAEIFVQPRFSLHFYHLQKLFQF